MSFINAFIYITTIIPRRTILTAEPSEAAACYGDWNDDECIDDDESE